MASLVTHKINGREYQIGKLDPFKQLAVARRLAPLIADLGPLVAEVQKRPELFKDAAKGKTDGIEDVLKSVQPLVLAFSKLADADVQFVTTTLLECVAKKEAQGGGWANMVSNGSLMFHDIELPELMQVAWRAGVHNLGGFFPAGRSPSTGGSQTSNAQ